ncbi:MAG: type I glyceraldehyde-3-phosphate dehydrogenase [Deltaproteobacteria bacterium]|nr:type I glyceraldehyde-3-phosphate dehydrogenase [Deltaproteobacteria bacterium]MBI3295133.1 type I glyceraldehyde-3-phosphate dehydrogenase [Deltaproteobacteria bacterium]
MRTVRVGINGFGRIGRVTLRLLSEMEGLEVAAINDLTPLAQSAHLLKYDSVHGPWDRNVGFGKECLTIDDKEIKVFARRDPSEIPWKDMGVDVVIESTGIFTGYDGASKHLTAGAKKVVISAPCKDNDKIRTFVYGINHETYDPAKDNIVSNASCTTNCLAPLVKVLNDKFTVQRGLMTTVHSYTNDQRVLDLGHEDFRRMRAAALNMIPTTTGAAKAVGLVIPEVKGKLTGLSVRVPTPNVSLVDFVADVGRPTSVEEVNKAFEAAAASAPLKGILQAIKAPLVSSDFNGCDYSSSVDLESTMVSNGTMVKVLSWYDNETGFSRRMLNLIQWMGRSL